MTIKSLTRHSLIVLAFAVIATAWPISAELPSECRDIAESTDPPPAHLVDHCRQFVPPQERVPVHRPTDMADGVDNVNGTDFCASLTLNAPELVSTVGMLPSIRSACDFAHNDFTKLYCYDIAMPGNFYSINPSTCVESFIGTGSNTTAGFAAMAWDVTTGTMFATTFAANIAQLFTVNLATGASTLVGSITNSPAIPGIGVDRSGDLFGFDVVSDNLLAIDKTTAAGTIIGPLGFDSGFAQGMDFDHSDGTCYLFAFNATTFQAELRTCNTCTGATSLVGAIGSTTPGGQNDWTAAAIRTPDTMNLIYADGFDCDGVTPWSSSSP